ncbi:MAG: hypothetical protein FJ202_04925 [Gemmatimonadetes bacterium]|nr:hypothetical protein [Gemmatimonadota bacterium]
MREIKRNGAESVPSVRKVSGATRTIRRDPSGAVLYVDSTETYTIEKGVDTTATKWMILELALGYSQFSALKSNDRDFELRGVARELPSVGSYLSFSGYIPFATPFIGIQSGIIDIQNLQAISGIQTSQVSVYSGAPKALQMGAKVGLAVGSDRALVRVEYAYHFREFHSLQWGASAMPTKIPRELSFSGGTLSTGLQINLRDFKP